MKTKKRVKVVVWVCRECGNYYASVNAGDLSTLMNTDRVTKKPTFPRSRCPTRTCADKQIDREPVIVHV